LQYFDWINLQRRSTALLLTCVLCMAPAPGRAAASERLDDAREAAVLAARGGDAAAALGRLEALFGAHPDSRALRLDLAVVAAWAGRDARAAELLASVEPSGLPDYVLEAYAKSARNLKRWDQALELYGHLAERAPGRSEPALARVLVLADADRFDAARAALDAVIRDPEFEPGADAHYACGYIEERARRYTQALACYRTALRVDPEHRRSRRRYAITASALGANAQARHIAAAHPGLLDATTLERLALDQAALHVRWARLAAPEAPRAHARAALDAHAELFQRDGLDAVDSPRGRALHFDHVAALAAAGDMAAAARAFEVLDVPLEETPVYVLAAAADAYLYLERPEPAERLFEAALAREPDRLGLHVGLFYARSDMQDHAGAAAVVARLRASEPAWKRPAPGVWQANPRFARARELGALELAFRDRYGDALEAFDTLLALAPANTGIRLSRAQVRRWRGWSDAARSDLTRVRALESDHHDARLLDAHLALDSYRFEHAREQLLAATSQAPQARGTLELAERWRIHSSPELILDGGAGRSDGGAFSSREWQLEGYYLSAPIHRYRVFVHDTVTYGSFDEGPGRDHRLGAGLEYRAPDWTLRGEVYRGLQDNAGTGAAVDADWRVDDRLSLSATAATNSRNVPLRATRIGVEGNELALGARYRWHEAREVAVGAAVLDLDDDNTRRQLQTTYRQRVFNAPRHKLFTTARAYGSRNSEPDRAYYNPEADRELSVGMTHEWRLHRRYDRSLTQRLGVEVGDYWQEDFGSGTVWTLFAEHDWQLGPRTALRYGLRTGGRVYDGEREHMASLFVGVTWRP